MVALQTIELPFRRFTNRFIRRRRHLAALAAPSSLVLQITPLCLCSALLQVYWVGPLSAAVILGYGWPLLMSPVPEPHAKDHADVPLTVVSSDGKRHSRLADDEDEKTGY